MSRVGSRRPYVRCLHADPCSYCGAPPPSTVDHIAPWTSGGATVNHAINLTAACAACNQAKGDRPLLWFLLGLEPVSGG